MRLVVVVGQCWPLLSVLGRPRDGPANTIMSADSPRCAVLRTTPGGATAATRTSLSAYLVAAVPESPACAEAGEEYRHVGFGFVGLHHRVDGSNRSIRPGFRTLVPAVWLPHNAP